MFSSTVYIPHADPALPDGWSLTGPMPDEFLGLSPSQLEDERGRYQILLIDAVTEQDAAVYQHKLDRIEQIIERYRNHPTVKIRWPDGDRSNGLVRLAQDLKRAVPLERFISDQVLTTRLERAGDRWKGTCPIPTHDDTHPSFVVYPDGGWHCFGKCNRFGDIYTLIGLVFGLELFRDQVALLADYYGREMIS
jgi:hypothetical protein